MKRINEIFYEGANFENDNIIKNVNVNWDAHSNGILNIAKNLEPGFIVTEDNKFILKKMLLYFTGDKEFDGSLKKGLMICGGVGTGKTLLFEIFKLYTGRILRTNSYRYYLSTDIIDNVNVNGVEYLELFNNNYSNPITCYIDDIASRNEIVKYYGTEVNAMEQLLSIRYNVYSRYRKLTHVSLNKYPNELKDIYDARIIDRMKEMFNIIELKGSSFRE